MSNNSGIADQVITLPKGGGSLQGIGETFAPNMQTGTGNFTVPLALPSGRNGFQPKLSLTYSTGNGNAEFGLGWNLSVPGVARKTSKGIPVYDDGADVFILSGAEDLVPVSSAGSSVRYRPRTEGIFALIEHHRTNEENYWKVQSKDGLISYYGTPRPANAPADWQDPAALTSPTDPKKVAAWKLSESRDAFGNRILYDYEQDVGPSPMRRWNQLYLKRIRYADYDDQDGSEQFLVSVEFAYEDRPDPFSVHRSAFEIRTTKRCAQIEMATHADRNRLARRYEFVYLDQRSDLPRLQELLPLSKVSLLSQIKVVGLDGDQTENLPPLEFGYSVFAPEKRRFFPLTGSDLPPVSLADPDYDMADLFGNSLPDVFEMNGAVRFWRNLGEGNFALPHDMRTAPAGVRLSDAGVQLLDANGDGRIDVLVSTQALTGYFPLRFDGTWDGRSFQRNREAPSFDLKDSEVKLVDLNGDGIPDAIRSAERFEIFFNDPERGWNSTRRVARRDIAEFPNVNFSDPRVKWGDMSGDGLQDIVLVYDGSTVYWPNAGYGDWGQPVAMRNSPRFPDRHNPARILLGDVDGDGVDDLVYIDDKKVILWINQSGNAWSEPIVVTGTPPVSDLDAVRLVDLLGAGVPGILWTSNFDGLSRAHMFFLDLTGGTKPYLLNEMVNNIGATTRVQYASSTQFYIEDQKIASTRWKTSLPFPVQVVQRVEVIDELSKGKLTTEYRYHHGHWDGAEREFRGFGMVEKLDSEVFGDYNIAGLHGSDINFTAVNDPRQFSPPTHTKTWFHLGPVGDEFGDWEEKDFSAEFWPYDTGFLQHNQTVDAFLRTLPSRRMRRDALRALRGSILRTELYALDDVTRADRPYSVTEYAYGLRLEETAPNQIDHGIYFPHLFAQRSTQWERGNDPLTRFAFTETKDYDAFGQPVRSTQIACPRGWRGMSDKPAEPYLATRTRTTYSRPLDPGVYIVDRVGRTTSFEIRNEVGLLLEDLRNISDSDVSLVIIGQSYHYYDGDAFLGLALGQVGAYGARVRTEALVLTEGILDDAYKSGVAQTNPPEEPPYLTRQGTPIWTNEYPTDFRTLLAPLAGYVFRAGGPEAEDARGFFAQTERLQYDFQASSAGGMGRGLRVVGRDPLGNDTTISYDQFPFLPIAVTDAASLTTRTEYDYRVLKPRQVTDLNGNATAFAYTPLGMLSETFVRGKAGEGDQTRPSVSMTYDLFAFLRSKRLDPRNPQPIFSHATRRVHHDTEVDVPLPERDETIESREYSDGFGRILQVRSQAEDLLFGDTTFGGGVLPEDQNDKVGTKHPVIGRQRTANSPANVVVSGWQVYDNKGRVVEKYEPFYSTGFDYAAPTDEQLGEKVELYYDPRGQIIRTVNPDGSEQRVIYGVPGTFVAPDLDDPDRFEPTPWEAYTYDANDNAGRTHPLTASSYRHHWNTPASVVIDALGRTVIGIARNRDEPANPSAPLPPIKEVRTVSIYDIRGNVTTITDALGRLAFTHVYDLANRLLRIENLDVGIRRRVLDAAGNLIEGRDSKGALVLNAYDLLNRPTLTWARDATTEAITLRGINIYGDDPNAGLSPQQITDGNLLGKPYRIYDEAGRLSFEHYDFKGGLIEKLRQVIADSVILAAFNPPPPDWEVRAFRVDWELNGAPNLDARAAILLDATEHRFTTSYDAINRVKTQRYPQDVTAVRKLLRPEYNRAGALQRVVFDGATYIAHIAYTAKKQRALIAYGNGVMTRYAYDARIFRLRRLRTEGYTSPTAQTFNPSGAVMQDFAYDYDLAGNLTRLQDRTPESGILNTPLGRDALDRGFDYDPLYRLVASNGRECDQPLNVPWDDSPRCADLTKTRAYDEAYNYDDAGNIIQLSHAMNRLYTLIPNSNRLANVMIGQAIFSYAYDANGNLTAEDSSRHFEWDQSDRMRVFRTQTARAEPTVHSHYLYDGSGQRVKKLVRVQGGQFEATTYIDGIFELYRAVQNAASQQNNTLHIMDDQSRVALVRVGLPASKDSGPPVKYQFGDHVGSCSVVVGGAVASAANFVNREEYTPYGETSFGSFRRKRYRFAGKERDEESGLSFFGMRSYLPWIQRWSSADPLMAASLPLTVSLYCYARCNPVVFVDLDGLAPDETGVTGCDLGAGAPPASESTSDTTTDSSQSTATSNPADSAQSPAAGSPSFESEVETPSDTPDVADAKRADRNRQADEASAEQRRGFLANSAHQGRQDQAVRYYKEPRFGVDLSGQGNLDAGKTDKGTTKIQDSAEEQIVILYRDYEVFGGLKFGDKKPFSISYFKDPSVVLDFKYHKKDSEGKHWDPPSVGAQITPMSLEWQRDKEDFLELGLPAQPLILDSSWHLKWQAGPELDLHLDSFWKPDPKLTIFGAANFGGTYSPSGPDGRSRFVDSASIGLGIKASF